MSKLRSKNRIQVYVNEEEKQKLEEKAEEKGLSASTFLRLKGLDKI